MSFTASYHRFAEDVTISAEPGDYGRETFPHKPELMSHVHYNVAVYTGDSVQIYHRGKKDGVVEHSVSGLTTTVSRDNAHAFELTEGDVYRPMHDSSLRLKFVAGPPVITPDEVVCRSIRGHIFSGFEEERKTKPHGALQTGKRYLPHEMYFSRFIREGLRSKVTHGQAEAETLLRIQDENDALDQLVQRQGLDFHQTEGGYVSLPPHIIAERERLAARVLPDPDSAEAGPVDEINENDCSDADFLDDEEEEEEDEFDGWLEDST